MGIEFGVRCAGTAIVDGGLCQHTDLEDGVDEMHRMQKWLRLLLGLVMTGLCFYILYRGIEIARENGFLSGSTLAKIPEKIEEMAVDTYMSALSIPETEKKEEEHLLTRILDEFFPVLTQSVENQILMGRTKLENQEESRRLQEGTGEGAGNEPESAEAETAKKDGENKGDGEIGMTEISGEGGISERESGGTEETDAAVWNVGNNEGKSPAEHDGELEADKLGKTNGEAETAGAAETTGETETAGAAETTGEAETAGAAEITGETETGKSGHEERQTESIPWDAMEDFNYLLNNYFTLDLSTTVGPDLLNLDSLMGEDLSIQEEEGPDILIYHTHSQETFIDSVEGDESTTIVGVGDYLTRILEERYGYEVIHNRSVYDMVDGVLDRSKAYELAAVDVEEILAENPSIQVVIDLHRDGVEGYKFVTEIDGKPTAKIMFYNGLSQDANGAPVTYLPNPYISENLAFSFQLQMKAAQYYPGLTRNIYLQSLRYNLHFRPRSLLIESGTQLNTVEEEYNAMEPLADILNQVLRGQ